MCHNKHHLFHIMLAETTKVYPTHITSQTCRKILSVAVNLQTLLNSNVHIANIK